ncbi:uncharacterized protein LOC129759690, partial [Uranotaenia lowii]|uniref:uncharacterized protein LOC129759690 n=1 Tax=Uranotaenia lowii TaxID=190385 RepID=UPI0024799EF6
MAGKDPNMDFDQQDLTHMPETQIDPFSSNDPSSLSPPEIIPESPNPSSSPQTSEILPTASSSQSGRDVTFSSLPMSSSIEVRSFPTKRSKCYPETAKGPFEVFIRQKDKPINVLLVSAEIHKRFRTVKEIRKISLGKVRIIFTSREEANEVVKNELLCSLYRVYVPSERVEIHGVIYQPDVDLRYLVEEGLGTFKDPRVPNVSVLECHQLVESQILGDKKSFVPSSAIRVTFVGNVLPDYFMIDHVLIPVRLFSPKPMLCDKCKKFGHTHHVCANKVCCGKCGQFHKESECSVIEAVCIQCKGTHPNLSKLDCPVYQQRALLAKKRAFQKSKLSYAEMVRA